MRVLILVTSYEDIYTSETWATTLVLMLWTHKVVSPVIR